jgi:LysM repeat protein
LRSSASPVLRAVRRIVAGDPDRPVYPEFGAWLGEMRVSARAFADRLGRPARHAVDEILGGESTLARETTAPADTTGAKGAKGARGANGAKGAKGARTSSGDQAIVFLATHRRAATGAICTLLVAASVLAAIPTASAAGGQGTDDPQIAADASPADDIPAGDEGDQVAADALSDVAVYNVMQGGDDEPVASGGFQVYVVKGGDTLAKIGAKFGLSRNTIYWANSTRLPDPGSLRVGQKLTIPPANGVMVTVKASDTLSGLASKYKSTVKSIQAANNLSGTTVTVGQTLLVPCTPPALPVAKVACGAGCTWTGGKIRWPVPASHKITQYYHTGHWGLDIGAKTGTPVIASVGGKVLFAGWKSGAGSGGGIVVWINSGGRLYTTYNHLSRVYVRAGQTVKVGQQIAAVGSTGLSTGPHLHFEVWTCYPWSGGNTNCAKNPLRFM